MKHIRQRNDVDCGVAALAMACGLEYEPILQAVARRIADGHGLNQNDIEDALRDFGFAWQVIYQFTRNASGGFGRRSQWPPVAWAPAHIAQVIATREAHFVAIDADGRTFDSWDAERASLADPVYREIHWVMGLFKVSP